MSDECRQVFYQLLGVCGEVTVTPELDCGPVTVTCLDHRIVRGATHLPAGWEQKKCRFTVFQELCVAVPVSVTVASECRLSDAVCHGVSDGPCAGSAPES
ncbi:MAG TPA: hypothetical protein VD969_21640 [Symbiobacteriaceae bacterium]|nr:hypothetical protein [Symbiobacteriaceae bacterium]